MSILKPKRALLPAVLIMACICAETVLAQGAGTKGSGDVLRIRKLEGRGNRTLVKTPEFEARTSFTRAATPPRSWGRIVVIYDTAEEWLDDVTFNFYAMGQIAEKGQRLYSIYRLTVRYGDIKAGRNHMADAYLRPQALDRYGELVAVSVEVVYQGKVIATETDAGISLPEKWWANPAVVEKEGVSDRSGYLVDRDGSPFALINIDDYEVIR